MSFTGKATYSAGSTLPEIAEDVSDLISINSPHETPLLDALGDASRVARSTVHEWLEDALLPNSDTINDATYANPSTDTSFVVDNATRFRHVALECRFERRGQCLTSCRHGAGVVQSSLLAQSDAAVGGVAGQRQRCPSAGAGV